MAVLFISLITTTTYAVKFKIFPLDKYNQDPKCWINPEDKDYDKPLISSTTQREYFELFYERYYGKKSPWDSNYVMERIQDEILNDKFSKVKEENLPKSEKGFGANFQLYVNTNLVNKIKENMNLGQFKNLEYKPSNRAIAVKNLLVRVFPTIEPYFDDFNKAGEGYPFDYFQDSALWIGTPVYVIGITQDSEWLYVLTPHLIGWVQSDGIAKTDNEFINKWQMATKNKMGAIISTETLINDVTKKHNLRYYIGSVFPVDTNFICKDKEVAILIPYSDSEHNAKITTAIASNEQVAIMPLTATPSNFSKVISALLGRTYGWGNSYFYNDCSAELLNLYTPFGIWLPRNSAAQSSNKSVLSQVIDLSKKTEDERLSDLIKFGKKFTTFIYIKGHIMLYIGGFSDSNDPDPQKQTPMTYQNMWGLRPEDNSYRVIIAKSCFFPLKKKYDEALGCLSLSSEKRDTFKLCCLKDGTCFIEK